jgi:adsorption protein B
VFFDTWVGACLVPLAVWILLSGLDDFWITAVFWHHRRRPFRWPSEPELARAHQRRIAILLPLWREHEVIRKMLEHNLAVIRYANYDFFVGVYPNDWHTIRAVQDVARADPRVHVAVCPHWGPTSKADCLNRAYHAMAEHEGREGVRYEIVVTHDAEDLIHPESLRLINWFSREYEMIQIPVLPLPTSWREWTHGLYCDEFSEYQLKDIPVRQRLGGFVPSNGVGTSFAREALERLRREYGHAFDPESLTEDYENGFRMHAAGYRQIFLPVERRSTGLVATREYFPRTWRAAVRQRSRWVAGIALQGWQRHGWGSTLSHVYWFWRDRKGLAGNLLSPLANLLFFYWLGGFGAANRDDRVTSLPGLIPEWVSWICLACLWIAMLQMTARVCLSARIYGLGFAVLAPCRMLWGNLINCAATVEALRLFLAARVEHHALAWRKTEHDYPGEPLHIHCRPRLGEVLVSLQCLSAADLEQALAGRPPGLRIGEYLIQLDKITARDLGDALRSQAGLAPGAFQGRRTTHQAHRNFGLDST